MPEPTHSGPVRITLNGAPVTVEPGCTVATAIATTGSACRTSITGRPCGPLCAMGICFECRATINGIHHRRTCQLLCEPGMDIVTL